MIVLMMKPAPMIVFENDDNQGLAMGVVVGGFGGGAFIFNQIQVCVQANKNYSNDK